MIGVIFKRYIYIFIYIALIGATALNADTGQKLKSPSSSSFDFTFNQDFQKETQVDKTLIEIGKTTVLDRRLNNLFYCKTDKNGTEYCPEGLAKARDYTAYSDGGYLENTGQVTDYTNGTSVSNKGQVVDYANKIEVPIEVEDRIGTKQVSHIMGNKTALECCRYRFGNEVVAGRYVWDDWGEALYCSHTTNNIIDRYKERNWNSRCGGTPQAPKSCYHHGPEYTRACVNQKICPAGYVDGGTACYQDIKSCPAGTKAITETWTSNIWGTITFIKECVGKKIINQKICPQGYTATSGSETSKGECKKTVDYYYYEYTCPAEYKAINKGLTSCVKTDSGNTTDNTATLSQACNSATPPPSNCEKPISYKYYEYICEGKNAFDQGYTVVDKGMTSCTKTDTDKTKPNSNLANDCNVKTPPKNNCKSTEFTCDSTLFKPVFVDGKWQCSPFVCDGAMKCGYGTCPANTTPSLDKYMSPAYNPLRYAFSNKCNTPLCDYVFNRDVSYCERKACPIGDDIIEQNGKCYKLECPAGTYLSGDKCITGKY